MTINCLIRLTVLPTVIVLYILVHCGIYIVRYFGILCRLIAGVTFMLVVIGFVTGLGAGDYLIKMLAIGFGFFFIPQIGGTVVNGFAVMYTVLRKMAKI